MHIKKELIFIIPICKNLDFVKETVLDIKTYISKSHHIIFVDDTAENRFKDFKGEDFDVVYSGGNNGWAKIYWSVNKGLIHAIKNYDFDFVVYLDEDATIINPGFDSFIYNFHQKTHFDLLGPEDDVQDDFRNIFLKDFESIYEKYNLYNKGKDDFQESIFYAIHIYSKKFVWKMYELGMLEDSSLKETHLISDPYISYICQLIGCKSQTYGGMNQGKRSAKPPIFASYQNISFPIWKIIYRFSALHRTRNIIYKNKVLNEAEFRQLLKKRREFYNKNKNLFLFHKFFNTIIIAFPLLALEWLNKKFHGGIYLLKKIINSFLKIIQ